MKEMDLDLAKKQLQNELLKKQIELLENSQEYRCCPLKIKETPSRTNHFAVRPSIQAEVRMTIEICPGQ